VNLADTDKIWMQYALALAQKAKSQNEVPVGAVLIKENKIVGEGYNCPIATCSPIAHAEIQALSHASLKIGNYRLTDTTLYVTLEPCAMCAGAIIQARINRLVYGARDPKAGAVHSIFNIVNHPKLNHQVVVQEGILANECSQLLTEFFREQRRKKSKPQVAVPVPGEACIIE
jgi:tRNA(adenine34) deaminase